MNMKMDVLGLGSDLGMVGGAERRFVGDEQWDWFDRVGRVEVEEEGSRLSLAAGVEVRRKCTVGSVSWPVPKAQRLTCASRGSGWSASTLPVLRRASTKAVTTVHVQAEVEVRERLMMMLALWRSWILTKLTRRSSALTSQASPGSWILERDVDGYGVVGGQVGHQDVVLEAGLGVKGGVVEAGDGLGGLDVR